MLGVLGPEDRHGRLTPRCTSRSPRRCRTTSAATSPASSRGAYLSGRCRHGNNGNGVTIAIVDAYDSPTLLRTPRSTSALNDPAHPLKSAQFTNLKPAYGGQRGRVRRQRLVRRAVAGRRVLARHGAGREHPVRRREGLLRQQPARRVTDRRHQRRIRGEQLLGRHPRRPARRRRDQDGVRQHVHARRLDRRQRAVLQRRRRRQLRRLRPRRAGLPADQPVRHRRGRHHAGSQQDERPPGRVRLVDRPSRCCAQSQHDQLRLGDHAGRPARLAGGGGGGTSYTYLQPSYQAGVVPTRSRCATRRSVRAGATTGSSPDISMDADAQTGMLIGATQTFPNGVRYGQFKEGGTSLASPLLAGVSPTPTRPPAHRSASSTRRCTRPTRPRRRRSRTSCRRPTRTRPR